MIPLKAFFEKFATVKNIFLFFVLSLLVSFLFTWFSGALEYGVPDTYLHYTAKDFYALLEKYTAGEISIYIKSLLLLDFIYPVLYSLFLSLFIYRLSKKTLLSILPFWVLFFDYLENVSILILIMLMPSQYKILAIFAGYFTLAKWILTSLCVIIVLFFIVRKAKEKALKQKNASSPA